MNTIDIKPEDLSEENLKKAKRLTMFIVNLKANFVFQHYILYGISTPTTTMTIPHILFVVYLE